MPPAKFFCSFILYRLGTLRRRSNLILLSIPRAINSRWMRNITYLIPYVILLLRVQWLWASPIAQSVKNLPAMQETRVQFLSWEDPLENGNPLQCSSLENTMDRGAWWAAVHGVARVGHDLVTKPPPQWLAGRSMQQWSVVPPGASTTWWFLFWLCPLLF